MKVPPVLEGGRFRVVDAARDTVVAETVEVALTRRERTRGLLGRDGLAGGEALLLPGCRQVHTIGMRFAIDVVFLDARWNVRRTCTLEPGRLSPLVLRSRDVIELEAGALERSGVRMGDRLEAVPPVP